LLTLFLRQYTRQCMNKPTRIRRRKPWGSESQRVRILMEATGLSSQGVRNMLHRGREPRNVRLCALWRQAMRRVG
jgi:hypothetical protein